MSPHPTHPRVLRHRDGHEARVTFEELFFDLVYVFAITQLSHHLLDALTPLGALQTLVLWFAVWLGWQYTCWVTNWFDPRSLPIRMLLFAVMLVGLLMSAALPKAFAELGLLFALSYATLQVGRTLYVLFYLGRTHALSPNFQRILGWTCISAVFWVAGALVQDSARLALWAVAVACEYFSPMTGFWLPGLGRSKTSDWTIEGGHLAERCQLFMIVAFGESLLMTGATLAKVGPQDLMVVLAFLSTFFGALAMWWIYFNTSSHDGAEVITHASDPGRVGAYFHYVHAIIAAGVIVTAVGNELVVAHPHGHMALAYAAVLLGGPLLYLLGNGVYKRVVYGRFPLSHGVGVLLLVLLAAVAAHTDLLLLNALITLALGVVAVWESRSRARHPRSPHTPA